MKTPLLKQLKSAIRDELRNIPLTWKEEFLCRFRLLDKRSPQISAALKEEKFNKRRGAYSSKYGGLVTRGIRDCYYENHRTSEWSQCIAAPPTFVTATSSNSFPTRLRFDQQEVPEIHDGCNFWTEQLNVL